MDGTGEGGGSGVKEGKRSGMDGGERVKMLNVRL